MSERETISYAVTRILTGDHEHTNSEGKIVEKNPIAYFDILEFNDRFNDDIFRLVLSFLNICDLGRLEQVSKNLRLSQLCGEDSEIWKQWYEKKVSNLDEIMKRCRNGNMDLMAPFMHKTKKFKKTTAKAIRKFDSIVESSSKKRMDAIERSIVINVRADTLNRYTTKEDLLKFDISSFKDNQTKDNESIKFVVVGDGAVGKTSLMLTLLTGQYPSEYIPTVMDNYMDHYKFGDRIFRICYWDTATSDDYPRLRALSYPETSVFLATFSVVYDYSFENLFSVWIPEVRHHCPEAATVLVASKVDLRENIEMRAILLEKYMTKPISYKEGERAAILSNCSTYIETSSLENIGLSDFTEIILKAHFMNISKKPKEKKKCLLQ